MKEHGRQLERGFSERLKKCCGQRVSECARALKRERELGRKWKGGGDCGITFNMAAD